MKTPELLPEFQVNKSAKVSPDEFKEISKFFKHLRKELTIEAKDSILLETLMVIDSLLSQHLSWAKDYLGIDLGNRIPEIGKIKFFDEANWEKFWRSQGHTTPIHGYHTAPSDEIYLHEGLESRPSDLHIVMGHELVHSLANHTYIVKRGEVTKVEIYHYGFVLTENKVFNAVNEMITEMINIESLSRFRREGVEGSNILVDYGYSGYGLGVIFLDAVLTKLAESLQEDAKELRKNFYRAYFWGDHSIFRSMTKVFGKRAVQKLATMRHWQLSSTSGLAMLGEEYFGLDPNLLEEKFAAFKAKKRVKILDGVEIGLSEELTLKF